MTAATGTSESVGAPTTRVEGRAKVTGAARYAGDIPFDNLLYGWVVLSTIPHGRVRSIDVASALAMPGGVAVLHQGMLPALTGDAVESRPRYARDGLIRTGEVNSSLGQETT
jgi:xanthine dehydrogenase YagR molybdenum-binding subunit